MNIIKIKIEYFTVVVVRVFKTIDKLNFFHLVIENDYLDHFDKLITKTGELHSQLLSVPLQKLKF